MKNLLAKAIAIASNEFIDKTDKSGNPYILHCLWVMNKVRYLGDIYMIVAVLHDLIEDTDWTIKMLKKENFSDEILEAIDILTHKKGVEYNDYIIQIANNEIAIEVKLRDLEHNSKITRLKGLRDKDIERIKKYHESYTYLKNTKNLYYGN